VTAKGRADGFAVTHICPLTTPSQGRVHVSNSELRQAAVVLLSLPESEAALLLSKLEPFQVEAVAAEMARVGRLGGAERAQSLQLFATARLDQNSHESRGLTATQRILEQALGDRAPEMLLNVRRRLEQVTFDFLEQVDDQAILSILGHESPQTVTLILAHLPVRRAAQLLQALPEDRQGSIIRRIAALRPVDTEVLCAIQEAVQHQLASATSVGQSTQPVTPYASGLPNSFESSKRQSARWPLPLAS